MLRINLLNRFVILMFRAVNIILIFCGLNSFIYKHNSPMIKSNGVLRAYSLLLIFGTLCLLCSVLNIYKKNWEQCFYLYAKFCICGLARYHQYILEGEFLVLLNEFRSVLAEICVVARHRNIFRFTHLLLCALAIQALIRSMSEHSLMGVALGKKLVLLISFYGFTMFWAIFVIAITCIMLVFIALIACYDELHRCTRRISNDVRTLRSEFMENGQRMVLVEQLRKHLEELIALRARMFKLTMGLIKFFRFQLLTALLYWIGHEVATFYWNDMNAHTFFVASVGLLNIAFYCSIFEIFVYKSRLGRSFWNLHLLNYNKTFDRTVDELLHCELIENVRVSVYGLRLDMTLCCRIVLPTFTYFVMHFIYKHI